VDAEDSSIKELTGSGSFSSINSHVGGWRFILPVVGLGFLHRLMLWWVDAGGSSKMELTSFGISSSSNSLVVGWRFIVEAPQFGIFSSIDVLVGGVLEVHP
jgi:hypothetical protein